MFGRLTSCAWLEEERRVHELSEVAEIFGNVHADTVYRWKLDGPGSGGGKPKKITGAVAEKPTVLTHDMLRQGSCVSLEIMRNSPGPDTARIDRLIALSSFSGAWPFLVDGALCLVHPFNDRVFRLLNRVKYDSYLITSQREIVCPKYAFSASWRIDSLMPFFLKKKFFFFEFIRLHWYSFQTIVEFRYGFPFF